ncbi:MAG: PIN domain-containing protein [Candidatus Hadarchaeum sp.]
MILLDSSFIIAYLNEADENHAEAIRMAKDVDGGKYGPPIITDYIFDEVITVMLFKTKKLRKVAEAGEMLLRANRLLTIDQDTFQLAWEIFKEQKRATFSFTDCTSIAVCREKGISNVATFDQELKRLDELIAI